MPEWILEFDQVDYRYAGSDQFAIQALTLQIPSGKRCALIGQNGCGKTTFFLLANALYQPQRGTIRWQHQPIQYSRQFLTQLRQQVGLVFQNPEHQLVAATVEADISYGLYNLGLSEAEVAQRTQQAIIDFDLQPLAHQPIHHLSLGQKKRVSIADVMVLRPKLLLLDEPTAYLDPRHTRELIRHLHQIHDAGTTILLATHDLDFVYQWADWVFVMDQGQLVLEGTPETVFAQQDNLQTLGLGRPLAIELIDQIQTLVERPQTIAALTWKVLQQQIFQLRRLR
jgi:cobalt/nickel transport system ATP-binding protein